MDMDPDETVRKIREFTDPIYELGEKNEGGIWKVNHQNIKSKYKGKPDQASDVIMKSLAMLKDAILTIQKLEKQNADLRKDKSTTDIVESFGKKILHYVSENIINENSKSLVSEYQVQALGNVVEQKMESTMKQYSEVLKAADPGNTITLSNIRNIVKQAINTDGIDRSKNVVIFGLEEVNEENTAKAAEKVLESINLKPKITSANRFGRMQENKTRPIRVSFEKSETVHDVLKTSKSLKTTDEFRRVYISVDRSEEQQARHRELVKTLQKKIAEHPNKHWYIKNNQIKCNDADHISEDVSEIIHESSPYKVNGPRLFQS